MRFQSRNGRLKPLQSFSHTLYYCIMNIRSVEDFFKIIYSLPF
jgi:hypothetical protein